MRRKIATLLLAFLFLMPFTVFHSQPTYGVDAVSSATTTEGSTAAPSTPSTPSTPASSSTNSAAAADASSAVLNAAQVHIVEDGDMMWKIAAKYNLTLDQLIKLNPQVSDPNLIFVGQKIVVKANAQKKVYQGSGTAVAFRNGPGKDSEGVPVYSFNIAMAQATFDADGRILNVFIDGYEVATPNYDGESMPHFSGWPNKEGYNVTDHKTEKVSGVSVNTEASAAAEVNAWKTKRERGDSYHMNPANEWYKQMNFYQKFFVGKTVAELEAWFAKNTTSAGRPIKASTTNKDDLAKLAKLTEKEKAELADVVSGATMSLRDPHGDFLGAVANAYKNRVEVVLP